MSPASKQSKASIEFRFVPNDIENIVNQLITTVWPGKSIDQSLQCVVLILWPISWKNGLTGNTPFNKIPKLNVVWNMLPPKLFKSATKISLFCDWMLKRIFSKWMCFIWLISILIDLSFNELKNNNRKFLNQETFYLWNRLDLNANKVARERFQIFISSLWYFN